MSAIDAMAEDLAREHREAMRQYEGASAPIFQFLARIEATRCPPMIIGPDDIRFVELQPTPEEIKARELIDYIRERCFRRYMAMAERYRRYLDDLEARR